MDSGNQVTLHLAELGEVLLLLVDSEGYGEHSSKLVSSGGVHQNCPLSLSLLNFVTGMVLEATLLSSDLIVNRIRS